VASSLKGESVDINMNHSSKAVSI